MHNFHRGKMPEYFGCFCNVFFSKMLELKKNPICENSPNLVTLSETATTNAKTEKWIERATLETRMETEK
jgi:hypothetical protein